MYYLFSFDPISYCSVLRLYSVSFYFQVFRTRNSLLYLACKAWRFLEIYVPNAVVYNSEDFEVWTPKSLLLYNALYSMKWKSTFVNFRFTSLTLLNFTCLKLSQSSMSKQTIVNVSELWVSESPQLQNEKKVWQSLRLMGRSVWKTGEVKINIR